MLTSTAIPEISKNYLTPSKRRLNGETQPPKYTARELHSWTFSAESIAACTIDDVLNMTKNTVDGVFILYFGVIQFYIIFRFRFLLVGPCSMPEC